MALSDRKLKILEAIITDYIETAEPIGSRTIAKKYDLGISPATIRNEMSDLEEMGLIEQPHTSAGRIPSDKGYRLYVDNMMQSSSGLSGSQAEYLAKAINYNVTKNILCNRQRRLFQCLQIIQLLFRNLLTIR